MNKIFRSTLGLAACTALLVATSTRMPADTGACGGIQTSVPFTDVSGSAFFCQIAEAFVTGLTNGTSPNTYSPSAGVPREQMAAFITRTLDAALRRGSRRAALKQWSIPSELPETGKVAVGTGPTGVKFDGKDLWVANTTSGNIKRVRASDGQVLETWTGASFPNGVLVARGRVYVTGGASTLYVINPSNPPGAVAVVTNTLGFSPDPMATDGHYIWSANTAGSVSRVDPDTQATTTISAGFSHPQGILFDGSNIWVADLGDNNLKKLDSNGGILQTVATPSPYSPVFDGANIWVPNRFANSLTVVRSRDGMVLATLTGNGLNSPSQAAFDGERILVTNTFGHSVSLWKATDLAPLGSYSAGPNSNPYGACSDGINFWITLSAANQLARF